MKANSEWVNWRVETSYRVAKNANAMRKWFGKLILQQYCHLYLSVKWQRPYLSFWLFNQNKNNHVGFLVISSFNNLFVSIPKKMYFIWHAQSLTRQLLLIIYVENRSLRFGLFSIKGAVCLYVRFQSENFIEFSNIR